MARKTRKKKKESFFDFFTEKKVTYHRNVKKERTNLIKEAQRAELAEIKKAELAERKRKALKKKTDDVDRRIEKEMREQGLRNPPQSLKKGVRGLVKLVGRGKSRRLLIYT